LLPVLLSTVLAAQVGETPPPDAALVEVPAEATSAKDDAKRFLRVAVYDLSVDGVEPRVGRFVTDAFVAELRKLEGVSVVAMDEVRAMLTHEAQKQLVGCDEGASCLSELGDALGVDELVVGSLAVVGGASVITVRRVDQARAKAVGSLSERLTPAGGEEFLATVGPFTEKLYNDRVLKKGAVRGVPVEQAKRLNPPPLSPWIAGSTAAASLVLMAGGAFAGLASLNESSEYKNLLTQAETETVAGSSLVARAAQAESFSLAANVLYGSAAIVGIAAVALVPWTNFEGTVAPE